MKGIYYHITQSVSEGKKSLAVLIDPDKMTVQNVPGFIENVNNSIITFIFVGGSTVETEATHILVSEIKKHTSLPVVLFPGDVTQISEAADALLFLSLISGDNPEYLIGKHIKAVPKLMHSDLETIPTGYILIENGKQTTVEKVTETKPIPRENKELIMHTSKAAELLGMQLIYLEAGSGALHPVPLETIRLVKQNLNIPLIVGGGIRSKQQLNNAFEAGADIVVIGTAFETNEAFFEELKP
ncbi:geranylgeranylglyceryl/heptaprenylglyceryl phosphate synthase [Psychroserpens sp. XS_ASV72]|uniref:geranylgeranylglyceryl/heptaprenylglyceryl phosphate synthase n=1 Tax=Psychroserpens sp. XS_ASV72 TaxID=3241293 RepID=UPI0035178E02